MAKEKSKTTILEEIKTAITDLITQLGINATVEVKKATDDHFSVNIQTQETGLLIGRHGEILNSLQLLLGVIVYKKLGKWVRIVLDVGDYRRMREESIKEMVTRIVAEVEVTTQPVTLPYLTPLERRIVHMMLAGHEKVTSQSQGEGKERRVVIQLKASG